MSDTTDVPAETDGQPQPTHRAVPADVQQGLATASLGALGIVYGDLGTSPLYTLQTVVQSAGGTLDPANLLGILSLLVWTLIITISIKYCLLVMRADNHGEGGILALMALLRPGRWHAALVSCGLFGAALIYGDGVITPAISVLSALEGLNVATAIFKPYVLPAAVVILVVLFAAQALGTAKIGRVFGPVMLLWFIVIAVIGAAGTIAHPKVIAAVNPAYAIGFLVRHGSGSFLVLGGVFLAITGGEAMYADMGHLGRRPIRVSWYSIVLPALLLSYAGQIGYLLDKSDSHGNPFFEAAPQWLIFPLVGLATFATIIASQAIITGAFSLTRQAMQLGWFPGVHIRQTSDEEYGQIYVPLVNWMMMVGTVTLAVAFGSSDKLSGAYGTAVSTTMLLTTALLFDIMRNRWNWPIWLALPIAAGFMLVDLGFFLANLLKIADGGWVPLLLGFLIFLLMTTWHRGVEAMRQRLAVLTGEPGTFQRGLIASHTPRVPGTAVFMSRASSPVPSVLTRHVRDLGALPEKIVTVTVVFEEIPRVRAAERVQVEQIDANFWHITVHFGFLENPSIPAALTAAQAKGCDVDLSEATYFAARDEVVPSVEHRILAPWRRNIFAFLLRNSVHVVDVFALPRERFIEIGRQLEV
jgi:KUP system potassium uptake protein